MVKIWVGFRVEGLLVVTTTRVWVPEIIQTLYGTYVGGYLSRWFKSGLKSC